PLRRSPGPIPGRLDDALTLSPNRVKAAPNRNVFNARPSDGLFRLRFYRSWFDPARRTGARIPDFDQNDGQENDRHHGLTSLGRSALSPARLEGCGTRDGRRVLASEAKRRAKRRFAMGFKVAVVGATGNVGREMLNILEERGFPADEVVALASRRSIGTEVSYGDKTLKVRALETYDFSDTDIALMSAGGNVSKEWSPKIGRQGCVVIDNSSAWRYDPEVPLIVPEVNPDAVANFAKKNIIANPNCSTAQMVVALKPLHDAATIRRIVVSTYQSVSGAGKDGMDELFTQTRAVFVADPVETKKFTKRIAFNVIPHIDVFMEDGSTKEEWKMLAETKKMLDPKIKLT